MKTRSEGIIVLKRGLPVFNDEEMRIRRKAGRYTCEKEKTKKICLWHVRVNLRNLRPRRVDSDDLDGDQLVTLRTGVRSFPKKGASVAGGGPAH